MADLKKIVVGITGASGFIYAERIIRYLNDFGVEIHLVMTKAAQITRAHESELSLLELKKQVNFYYPNEDIGASIASGSFQHDGMVILPCSMNTVAELACGTTRNLLTRAADVCLKEKRRLIILPREAPLHTIHLRNMTILSEIGAIIYPPMPAFYQHPKSLEEMVDNTVVRILAMLHIGKAPEWHGWY